MNGVPSSHWEESWSRSSECFPSPEKTVCLRHRALTDSIGEAHHDGVAKACLNIIFPSLAGISSPVAAALKLR
jgi:hypothetical protein